MALKLACPHCQKLMSVPSKLQGQVVDCPKCLQQFRVPVAPVTPASGPIPQRVPSVVRDHSGLRTVVVASVAAALVAVGGLGLNRLVEYRRNRTSAEVAVAEAFSSPEATSVSLPGQSANLGPGDAGLAAEAKRVLQNHCHRCHGQDGVAEGGFNFIMRRDRLVSGNGYVTPGKPDESYLLTRIVDKEMPPPGDGTAPSPAEIETLRQWIAAGAPDFTTGSPRDLIANADIVRFIRADLEQVPSREQRHTRYFTLTNLYNAGFSDDEMQTYRLALSKLVNSLSWHNRIVQPQAIDPRSTIYRMDIRTLGWDDDVWTKIIEADPYSVQLDASDPDGKFCLDATQCQLPHVRADWFVAAASKPPLYHQVLQVPETLKELLTKRFTEIDLERDIKQESVRRVGVSKSGVSQNNRLLEWHHSSHGYFWVSYDFAGNIGRKNLFKHPLGPGTDAEHFEHDGGEIIFSLPNGLQGYMLIDAKGSRLDKGPTSIVSDPRRPDRAVTNGVSCMGCHYAGIISKSDDLRRTVEVNRGGFAKADQIMALYPPKKELDKLYAENAAQFRQAVNQVGIEQLTETGEPIVNMALRFDTDVDATAAASELGLTLPDFVSRLKANPKILDQLSPLAVEGGTVKRELFAKEFAFVIEELRLGTPLKPKPAAVETAKAAPVAETPGAATPPTTAPATTPPTTDPPTRLRIFTDRSGKFKVEAELVDEVDGKIRLKRADGTLVEVSLSQLSEADQTYVSDELAKLPPGEDVPPPARTGPVKPGGKVQAPPPGPAVQLEYRSWTNLAIRRTINGALISLHNGEIKIQEKRYRGAITRWPMEHLRPEDQAYVAEKLGREYFQQHYKLPEQRFDPFGGPF